MYNPVQGPILYAHKCTSTKSIEALMLSKICCLPNYNFPVCDVRDLAKAHLKAMTLHAANNNRHIIVSRRECLSVKELALTLENEFKSRNYNVPTRMAPNWTIKLLSLHEKSLKQVNTGFFIKCLL